MVMREKNIASYFSYELSPYATSLFKDGIMRDPKISKLRGYLKKNVLQAELPVGSITHILMVALFFIQSNGYLILHTEI